jgi:N,N'-diacetyllegionaminate synthase
LEIFTMALMRIGKRLVGDGHETLMFAEEGQANDGDMSIALDMCRKAAAVGADGIEFQLSRADDMYVFRDAGHAIYSKRELSAGQVRELIDVAHGEGLLFQVAGFSPRMIEISAAAGADVFCVNATDLTNPVIIDAVVATGRPFWLATLMGKIEEIDWAVDYALSHSRADVGVLHGQHVMSSDTTRGVPSELLQLDCIDLFKRRYGLATGFVDHTATTLVPALAAAKGAALVMKHLSPQPDWRGADWVVCLDPQAWREARTMLTYAVQAGGESKEISQAEFKDRSIHRRSIYTVAPLASGHRISAADLVVLRPGSGGLDPRAISEIIGRRTARDLPAQHQLQIGDLA